MGEGGDMTATYRNEQHAAIRAVSVDAISTAKPAGWQQQYRSGFVEELTKRREDVEHLDAFDRLTQDCMTRALCCCCQPEGLHVLMASTETARMAACCSLR